jgi:hypothetical protein
MHGGILMRIRKIKRELILHLLYLCVYNKRKNIVNLCIIFKVEYPEYEI